MFVFARSRVLPLTFVGIMLAAGAVWTSAESLLAQVPNATTQNESNQLQSTRIEPTDVDGQGKGWNVVVNDQMIAGYLCDSGGKPIVYPIRGPGGHAMTRHFPMKKNYGMESGDHDHQRSMWLSHGEVNGIDFWADDQGCGRVVHRTGNASVTDRGSVLLVTQNDWLGPDGSRVLSDTRRFEFSADDKRHVIDCDFLLKATDGDVKFGDTKEGTFGMRVAASLKVDAKKGGLITNAEMQTNKDAWGKPSPWVDYSGPVDNEMVGITIHNHPSSFGFPTRWHVRTYGLFAANPFGRSHFDGGKKLREITLRKGKTLRLNYRVVIYQGTFDPKVAETDAQSYHNDPRPVME